ncbi:hypothetical protein [Streptomyces tanashiensis]|uniref:hypothetical protein n=1 Tax=Streptomyces tanashiensis TaxID=67367 RepID=UPI00340C353F
MTTPPAYEDSHLSRWLRVREFAVPPSMIETATARRQAGDWAGACAAAHVDVDLDLRALARSHGTELAARVRADLRRLAPDLLRWHMPRIAPDGLLRPGLTVALARYGTGGRDGSGPVHLVARTAPAWADSGQRISLALRGRSPSGTGHGPAYAHPHPRPHPRFRLDLHRHLWDASRSGELRTRSGASDPPPTGVPSPDLPEGGLRCAVGRWAEEAAILLRAEGRPAGPVAVRLGKGNRLLLDADPSWDSGPARAPSPVTLRSAPARRSSATVPVLPDAATWLPPDLELLRAGLVEAGGLHPLVAAALVPGHGPAGPHRPPDRAGAPRLVECRGARHRIGLVDGVLTPLDHDPAELRREELLVALTGTALPCVRAVDEAHRRPDCLTGVRERLDHGDIAGALAVVEGLLGPAALLRDGALRDVLEAAARRRVTYGLYRAGLVGPAPGRELAPPSPSSATRRTRPDSRRTRTRGAHPRHATSAFPSSSASR